MNVLEHFFWQTCLPQVKLKVRDGTHLGHAAIHSEAILAQGGAYASCLLSQGHRDGGGRWYKVLGPLVWRGPKLGLLSWVGFTVGVTWYGRGQDKGACVMARCSPCSLVRRASLPTEWPRRAEQSQLIDLLLACLELPHPPRVRRNVAKVCCCAKKAGGGASIIALHDP